MGNESGVDWLTHTTKRKEESDKIIPMLKVLSGALSL